MRKSLTFALPLLAAGMMLPGYSPAQQTPAASASQPAASQSSSTAKKSSTTTAKKSTATKAATPFTLKTPKDKTSYALGMSVGAGLHRQGVEVDPAIVARGLKDSLAGSKTLLTEEEARAILTQLQNDVRARQQEKAKEEGATNRKEGEAFLAANKSKEGVKTLPDGLQYKVLKEGTGPKPTANDTVSVNYRGTLINGKEFDSSAKHGGPASFQVGGVLKGWTEALQLMPVGSKWELVIPSDLAYGDRGAGPDIGPGDTLIFEVELLSIQEPKK